MMNKRYLFILVALGLFSFGMAAYAAAELGLIGEPSFRGSPYVDAPPAPDFELTDHRGETLSLVDLRGRAVLLFFGFTRCPDVCPLTLAKLVRVLDDAEIDPDRIAVAMITVDPEHDAPEALAEFVGNFGPRVIGLTGEPAYLEQVQADYGVFARETIGHDGGPVLAHTPQVFGIDGDGRLRVLIHADEPAEVVERDIRMLLRASR